METMLIPVRQILQMFLYAGVGYALYRAEKINQELYCPPCVLC